jgi:hypothetical protein
MLSVFLDQAVLSIGIAQTPGDLVDHARCTVEWTFLINTGNQRDGCDPAHQPDAPIERAIQAMRDVSLDIPTLV